MASKKKEAAQAPTDAIKVYKGFNADWTCRDYQFKVGETYTHVGTAKLCESGFHACEYPLDIFNYYPPTGQIAECELSGLDEKREGDSKRAGKSITIKASISIPLLIAAAIEFTTSRCDPATAKHTDEDQSASSATGDQSASSATGDQSASSATGDQSASSATGDRSASSATGDRSASSATGYQSASSATGDNAVAAAFGLESKAKAGVTGILILAWWDAKADRKRMSVGYVGENIEADKWYRVDESGQFVEA
jgi:hypothetical protein